MDKKEISENLMKTVGISVDKKKSKFIFKVPANIWDVAEKEFNFVFDMLKVGGDLPISELAIHLDEQASNEARFGSLAEIVRYQRELANMEFDLWYSKKFYEAKEKLSQGRGTDKAVHSYILKKYPKKYSEFKMLMVDLEFKYRLLNNAIYSSIVTKGKMLQSLRNVLQPNDFGGISVEKKSISSIVH
jgi:hypothetical protein